MMPLINGDTALSIPFMNALRDMPMDQRFKTIIIAAARAGKQFSVSRSSNADNADVVKELAVEFCSQFASIVWSAGADMDYFNTGNDAYLQGVDEAFADGLEVSKIIAARAQHSAADELVRAAETAPTFKRRSISARVLSYVDAGVPSLQQAAE